MLHCYPTTSCYTDAPSILMNFCPKHEGRAFVLLRGICHVLALCPLGWTFLIGFSAEAQSGVPLWTNRYNGPANGPDKARAVAVDGSGTVYATGQSQGSGTK